MSESPTQLLNVKLKSVEMSPGSGRIKGVATIKLVASGSPICITLVNPRRMLNPTDGVLSSIEVNKYFNPPYDNSFFIFGDRHTLEFSIDGEFAAGIHGDKLSVENEQQT